MLAMDSPERANNNKPGRLTTALTGLWMKRATIVANERLSHQFRLITIEGPALVNVSWVPGQKVQIAMGSAFVTRTYTPIEWNATEGRACILGYIHGDGPGSIWLRDVEVGDECAIFGPRASLNLGRLPGPLAIFGDETSIGLAYAAIRQDLSRLVTSHFEISEVESARRVVAQLGLQKVSLFAKKPGDTHVAAILATLPVLIATGATFVITGRSVTIQCLRQSLKQQAVPAARIVTKAYWAPGKSGLD